GHARRGPGAARAAIDRLLAIEDRIARIRLRILRLAGPQDMADALDRRILRMHAGGGLVQQTAHNGREAQNVTRRKVAHVAVVLLRLENSVEIAAVGYIEGEFADAGAIDPHR